MCTTKIAYIQCPTGISGDMFLGALLSLGVPLEYLIEKLNALGIENEYRLGSEFVQRNGQQATKASVHLLEHHHNQHHSHQDEHHHGGRHLPEIEKMIINAGLPPRAEVWSLAIFRQLAVAEGAVHGIAPEKVHFHEVGAVDAIVDIVGTSLGLDWLGIDSNELGLPQLYCSEFPTGGGTVRAAHGLMPVPVPAVLKLWEMRGCPVYSNGINKELVTPTGAAIATALACEFGPPPAMRIKQVGLGAGSLDLPIPNILRLWLGVVTDDGIKHPMTDVTHSHHSDSNPHSDSHPHQNSDLHQHQHPGVTSTTKSATFVDSSPSLETISVLETQIDDLSPQAIGYVFDALFTEGNAVDVFTQSIGMKKSRPGILLTVICHPENTAKCEAILFRETTTLGIRRLSQQRAILQREIQEVKTKYGFIPVKVAWIGEEQEKFITNIQPEYENCAELARKHNISWREVQRLALQSWHLQHV
jgi:pyridinium-3,5-bisthiocarboxylic acid mononucleotide nickel chelatase